MTISTYIRKKLAKLLWISALCLGSSMATAIEVTETFEAAGFQNHDDFSANEKITVGSFEYKVQNNGSLKTVIDPAAISIGFDRIKPVTQFVIKNTSGTAFAFRGFTASNIFEMNEDVNVSGYLDGALVTAVTSATIPWPEAMVDFSAIPEFDHVDEVRIENTDLYFIFEDMQYTVKEAQTITFSDPSDTIFVSEGTFPAPASSTSGLTVLVESLTPNICDVTNQMVTMISVGICDLRATQLGDANYTAATAVNQSVNITKANQTISFLAPIYKSLTEAPFTINAAATSNLIVDFTTSTPVNCSVVGDVVTINSVGTCTITANQPGDNSFNPAPAVQANINVVRFGDNVITVGEMSKPLLQYMKGVDYEPTDATEIYTDVGAGSFNGGWLEELATSSIIETCTVNKLCPQMPVSKEQLAKVLLKAKRGSGYMPPGALGLIFDDVLSGDFSADWIEDLSNSEISEGCDFRLYCPKELVTIDTFIKLLNRTFPR